MSVVFNTLPFSNKDGPYRPPSKNSSNTRSKNLKEITPRRDSKDYRMTLEGWSQTINSESFLFVNQDDPKPKVAEKSEKLNKRIVEVNILKNTLNNIPEGIGEPEKKDSIEKVQSKKERSQSENKGKEMLLRLEKTASGDKTPQPRAKKNYDSQFERSEKDRHRQTVRKLDQQRLVLKKAFITPNMEQIDESLSMKKDKDNEKTDRPMTSWKVVMKTPKSSKNIKNISQVIEQNQGAVSPISISPIKQTIHTINFQTKLSPSQLANLERFQVYAKKQQNSYKESLIKSARGASTSSIDKYNETMTGRESVQKYDSTTNPLNSPTAKIVPPLNFQPLRKPVTPVFVFPFNTEAAPENKSGLARTNWKTLQDDHVPAKRKISLKAVFRAQQQQDSSPFDDYCQTSGSKTQQKTKNANTFEISKIQPRPRAKESKPILQIPSPKAKTQRDSILSEISKEAKLYVLTQRSNIQNLFRSIASTSKIPNNPAQAQGFSEMMGFASVSSSRTRRVLNNEHRDF